MEKHEDSFFAYTRTHLDELRYYQEKLNWDRRTKIMGHLTSLITLAHDILDLPSSLYYKLCPKENT